jgi:hypothetical protein
MLAEIPIGGNIIGDYYIGNTHILICDAAYINNTPEDDRRVLDQAAQASLNIILHNRFKEP